MKLAGFTERIVGDVNVVPNYFSPYVLANKEIYISLGKEYEEGLHVFRGDSDQDRPNFVYRKNRVWNTFRFGVKGGICLQIGCKALKCH